MIGRGMISVIDASKFENELGWRAKENFDSGIRKTIDWYLNNEAWWRPIREEKYAGHRLGKTTSES
jgi:dTDP-glucose 4,6-dehydratase